MTLHQLRIFLAVAEQQHFSRAAHSLHMTQSAVSTQVKLLEEELNTQLFDRLGKTTHLTDAGRVLEEHARRILGEVRQAYQAMEELEGLNRGHVALGASTTPGTYLLPEILGKFRQKHPHIEVEYHIADTMNVEQMVLHHQVDFGVVGGQLIRPELTREAWLVDELIAVASPHHLLAHKTPVRLCDLQHEELILRGKGSATRQVIEREFEKRELGLNVAMELRDPESVKQMVVAGVGITICSKHAVQCELAARRLIQLKVQELPFQRELLLVSHRDKRFSAAASALLAMLRE